MTQSLTAFSRGIKAASKRLSPVGRVHEATTRAVRVAIEFCEVGNYQKPAQSLLESFRREFSGADLELELIPSSLGVFEVSVAGRLVFSKKATRRLPEPNEIFYHINAALREA